MTNIDPPPVGDADKTRCFAALSINDTPECDNEVIRIDKKTAKNMLRWLAAVDAVGPTGSVLKDIGHYVNDSLLQGEGGACNAAEANCERAT